MKSKYKKGICSCHGEERWIVNKSRNLCQQGQREYMNRNTKPLKRTPIKSNPTTKRSRPKQKSRPTKSFMGERVLRHIAVYCEFFGVRPSQRFDLQCEMGCGRKMTEIHHISARGMGGDPQGLKDVIENLMGLCHWCHEECTLERIPKDEQLRIHKLKMKS